jgi:hypothetical protein
MVLWQWKEKVEMRMSITIIQFGNSNQKIGNGSHKKIKIFCVYGETVGDQRESGSRGRGKIEEYESGMVTRG